MEFEKYWWGNGERFKCPVPCNRDHGTEEEAQACFDGCPRQPKPQKRVSDIIGPKGEDVVVIEDPVILGIPKRKKRPEADATGQP